MSEEILGGRVEKADFYLPFSPELNEAYDNQPIFRVLIDVYASSALGYLQRGYYIKFNESVYFINKKAISVFTNSQASRVLEFLKKTQAQFTVDVIHGTTTSGHQHVQFYDVSFNSAIYTLSDYKVFNSLWQDIEYVLFENLYSPSMVRFTGERLIWYAKLLPQHSLVFTNAGKIVLNYIQSQGHLEIYRIEREGEFVIPNYLYIPRENMQFFNHEIHQPLYVIPLGAERRIIDTAKETQILSNDHETITLQAGQYLLYHPIPQQRRVD